LKLARGNPGKRPINLNEPKPKRGAPKCPSWLDAAAKKAWREIVPELDRIGVLTIVDRHILENYCRTWSRWRAAEDFISRHGEAFPIKDDAGKVKYIQQFPQVAITRHLLSALTKMQQELGLTPSARSRIHIEGNNEPNDKLSELLDRHRRRVS
jgi:P27 family predicted phage terminase small subunit